MKLSAQQNELQEQLALVVRVASTRVAVQALAGVQLKAEDGRVILRATDMEVGIQLPLKATVEEEGSVVLPARLLADVVRNLPTKEVNLHYRPSEQDVD